MIRTFFADSTGKIILAQQPNAPLIVWAVASIIKRFITTGALYTLLDSVGLVALSMWAILEITQGDTPFRRVLGATVLGVTIYMRLR